MAASKNMKAPSIIKREHDDDASAKRVIGVAKKGRSVSYEDTSFVTGESPAVLDVNADLGRNGRDGYLSVDGPGNITVEISDDGTDYGGAHIVKKEEVLKLKGVDIDRIRLTWISDSSYRVFVV